MSMRASELLRRGASRPALMGILNVTPDSFSDGGQWVDPASARRHCFDMIEQGADIIDIGGESTRPGAEPVPEDIERERVLNALKAVSGCTVSISVDTMKASVARTAIEHGASIINDVSGLSDPLMADTAAELDVPLVIMSSYGTPATFRTDFIPGDAVEYTRAKLQSLIQKALDAGVREHNIIIDPGVGFGTTPEQAMELILHTSDFSFGRYPVLVGPSRKRFLAKTYPHLDADSATAEVCLLAAEHGADVLRVHDVSVTASRFKV